ncbi:universal stress protein [Kitasatospora sp. NPDC050543]|uniref:universal stress protein n=1 Tax=Kitasatospora sp. NPDC050543 TaxID=3364054 RepID=UPI0037936A29
MTGNGSTARVVVGIDGSPSSQAALRWAVQQAALLGATVDVVGAWEATPLFAGPTVVDPTLEAETARRRFDQEINEVLGDARPVEVHEQLVRGNPADVLLAAADGADLLVVGSRGHGTFARALLGSVSTRCAMHASCPVVIVRPPS